MSTGQDRRSRLTAAQALLRHLTPQCGNIDPVQYGNAMGPGVGEAFHVLNASLRQFFQPTYAYQIETIPGIKDMIAKFR